MSANEHKQWTTSEAILLPSSNLNTSQGEKKFQSIFFDHQESTTTFQITQWKATDFVMQFSMCRCISVFPHISPKPNHEVYYNNNRT